MGLLAADKNRRIVNGGSIIINLNQPKILISGINKYTGIICDGLIGVSIAFYPVKIYVINCIHGSLNNKMIVIHLSRSSPIKANLIIGNTIGLKHGEFNRQGTSVSGNRNIIYKYVFIIGLVTRLN